jgi:hypothetical protein
VATPLPTEGLPTPQSMAESVHNLGVTDKKSIIPHIEEGDSAVVA